MVQEGKIISLIKIVSCRSYAESFLNGDLYCNTVRWFRENGYDDFEGSVFIDPDQIRIGDAATVSEVRVEQAILQPDAISDINIFCMFAWTAPTGGGQMIIDLKSQLGPLERLREEFGGYAVVITNVTEFLRRIGHAARNFDTGVARMVSYVDPESHRTDTKGDPMMIPFVKINRFSHQKEYRVALRTNLQPAGPYILSIGSIRDIAQVQRTEDIYGSVKLKATTDQGDSLRLDLQSSSYAVPEPRRPR